MSLLDLLSNFLPDVNLHVGDDIHEETTNNIVIVNNGEGNAYERIDDTGIVDVAQFSEEEQEQIKDAVVEEWISVDELFRDSTGDDKAAMEANFNDKQIEGTLEYFRPILPEHYYLTLEAALHFRKQIDMMEAVDSDWVHQRRRDIAEKYDGETYRIINLCSAGYFDEGRYFRELYEEMRDAGDYKEGDYRKAFNEIVNQEPFTVFVSAGQTASDVVEEIHQKVRDHERYDVRVDFIDVRGMGPRNRDKIDRAIEMLSNDVGEFQIQSIAENPELVIRINPSTVDLSANES